LREIAGEGEWLFTDLAELDVTDNEAIETYFDRHKPDVAVNCAAFTDVDRAETDKKAAFRLNRDAPRFLAAACVRTGAALVHISTDFVFDGTAERPYTEEDAPSPLNVYGESKLAGEREVTGSGVRGAVVRTSWLWSPWGRNFVKSILKAASERDEIRVVADQRGCPTSAASLAAAIVKMIPAIADSSSMPAEIYHFCDAGVVSRAGFADGIIRQAGLECRVVPVPSSEYPSPAERPLYSALDTGKITRTFGIVPPPWQGPLAESINDMKSMF
jgi:dTDP-4-dehydrorhamnose reductase